MTNISVIDFGNGDIKFISGSMKEVLSFPAVTGQIDGSQSYQMADKSKKLDFMSFKKDGQEYAIGGNAIKNCKIRNHDITEDKYTSQGSIILANAALTAMAEGTYSESNLIVALPIHKMDIADSIIRLYKGHTFGGQLGYFGRYDSISKIIGVREVIAIEQPWGTLFKTILNERGDINKEMAKKGIGVFDIGFKTNDGIVFRNLETIGRLTIHSKNGMYVAFEEIQSKINRRFNGLEVKIFEVPEIINTGEVQGASVSNIISEAFYNLAYNIILEIKSRWSDAWEIEQIVFTGGGAELLKPYLVQAYKDAIYEDALANATGFLWYARRIWGDAV